MSPVPIDLVQTVAVVSARIRNALIGVGFTPASFKSLKDRGDSHGSVSPPTLLKASVSMITKALVNTVLMELVAPVAFLIFQLSALTGSPQRAC